MVFRKLRGMLGVGLTWGLAWAVLGALLALAVGALHPQVLDAGETPARIAVILGIAGFVSGTGFALALWLLERGRTPRDLSLARVALWGAVGAAIVPLFTGVDNSQLIWTCPLGALLATTSVTIARGAERRRLRGGLADTAVASEVRQQLRPH